MADQKVNFGTVAKEYALWRDSLPEEVYTQIEQRCVPFRHKKIVDIGCGTGINCRELVKRGAEVIGTDLSPEIIEGAKKIDASQGYSINYIQAPAESIPLPSHSYDIVTVLRAWHWFDRTKAISEVNRLLKERGFLIVMDSVMNPSREGVEKETFEIIKSHSPGKELHAPGSRAEVKERRHGLPANWFDEWEAEELMIVDAWEYAYDVTFTHESWRGKVQSLSNLATLPLATREEIDQELHTLLMEKYSNQTLNVPHRCSVVVLRRT